MHAYACTYIKLGGIVFICSDWFEEPDPEAASAEGDLARRWQESLHADRAPGS